jgi:hypothetical protein
VIFEDDEEPEKQPQLYDGALLEVDVDVDIMIPPVADDAPLATPLADAVDDDDALVPDATNDDAPMPDAEENEPGDSGDDSSSDEDGSSEDKDGNGDEEEDEDVDIEGMEDDNSVVANNGDNNNNDNNDNGNDNDNDNGNENEDDQGNEHRYRRAEYHMHTYIGPDGQFCELLEELLQELDHTVRPLYVTRHYVEPGMRDYYTTEAHVRVVTGQDGKWRTRTILSSTAHFSSEATAINDAARWALWSISNSFRDRIHGIDFRFIPSRVSGTEEIVVPMGDFRDSCVDILARVTIALNTDLEGTTA